MMESLSKYIRFESIEVKIGRFGSRSRTEFTFSLVSDLLTADGWNIRAVISLPKIHEDGEIS